MSVPFAIDSATGNIRFPDFSLELRPLMLESEFIAATAPLNRDNLGGKDGWQRYSVRGPISEDRKLGMFVVFLNERLKMLSFAYAQKDESWDKWTEEGERQREKEYRAELAAQLGASSSFPWGRAQALPDSHSGSIEIWVEFV
jgi:hypothetical protein